MSKPNRAIYVIGVLFFIFGFVTWINSVLIPFLQQICQLTDFQAYWVTFAFYISYFVMALPSSWVLKKTGFVRGMSLGLGTMAVGSLLFIPAALQSSYMLFLGGLFLQGTGLALLQTASNPYVTILGPIESAAQRISIMGICNKVAGMIGIFLLSYVLFNNITQLAGEAAHLSGAAQAAELQFLTNQIINPYLYISIVLALLAVGIRYVNLPEIKAEENVPAAGEGKRTLWQHTYLWLGVAALFCYVGVEVIAIDTLPLYGEYQGLSRTVATKLGTYSLIALTAGYLLGILTVPRYLSQRKALMVCITLDLIFLTGALLSTGITSVVFVILLSFGHALVWPSLWPLAIEGLGRHTQTASALLVMGIAGGAVFPLLYGGLADMLDGNRQLPYLICVPAYLFILYFAIWGYKVRR